MPVLTAAACTPSVACPATPFPVATAVCTCEPSQSGVNDIYIIPCDQEMTEENILDTAFWQALKDGESTTGSFLGNLGKGVGSITKKTDKKFRFGSCEIERVTSTTWALKYVMYCFDKSADKVTHEQVNALISNAKNYQLIARMCDGPDTVLPVGPFTLSDFNWVVTDDAAGDPQSIELEFSWIELGMPKTYVVTGLSAIVPKA